MSAHSTKFMILKKIADEGFLYSKDLDDNLHHIGDIRLNDGGFEIALPNAMNDWIPHGFYDIDGIGCLFYKVSYETVGFSSFDKHNMDKIYDECMYAHKLGFHLFFDERRIVDIHCESCFNSKYNFRVQYINGSTQKLDGLDSCIIFKKPTYTEIIYE